MEPCHRCLISTLIIAIFAFTGHGLNVTLTEVSTLYLPVYDANGMASYGYALSTLEQFAVQREGKLVYALGANIIYVIDASDVTNLTSIAHVLLPDLGLTDVEVCGEGVFVTYQNSTDKRQGGVLVYRQYSRTTGTLELLHDIPVGSLPDMLYPTSDCTVVVALENEGFVQGGVFYDPPGGVAIIRFPSGITVEPEVKLLDFTRFNDQFDQLSASGVRWVYRGSGNNFSNNVEPEYIAFNSDYTTAYVALQENNAIAVVDLTSDRITAIHGLGFKQWGDLDPSDRDGGIHIQSWPVYGMYQPDSIKWVRWNNEDYIITANEGDAQEYAAPASFTEEIRGRDILLTDIADSVSEELKQALQNDTQLGRLTFSNVDGKDASGKFEKFYSYGGRSFSVWRAADMSLVFDSGSDMGRETARRRPDIFNANANANMLLSASVDIRSDNKGAETESLAVGELQNHLLIFAGNERPGTIAVYSVAQGGMQPEFRTLYSAGIPQDTSRTWSQLYDARELHGVDPECIEFFSASDGLADFPVLLVAGSVGGTLSVLRVDAVDSSPGPTGEASISAIPTHLLLMACLLVLYLVR